MTTNWTMTRTSSPESLPVSLAEAKDHLRLSQEDSSHDANLTLLLTAATERLEQDLDRQILTATYKQSQFCWRESDIDSYGVKIYKRAVTAVDSLEYYDADGVLQTIAAEDFVFDPGRCEIFPVAGEQWPTLQQDNSSAVQISFTAGYGDADCVPRLFKAAILLSVGKWFFDPAQEGSALHSQEVAYERIVTLLMRSTYP